MKVSSGTLILEIRCNLFIFSSLGQVHRGCYSTIHRKAQAVSWDKSHKHKPGFTTLGEVDNTNTRVNLVLAGQGQWVAHYPLENRSKLVDAAEASAALPLNDQLHSDEGLVCTASKQFNEPNPDFTLVGVMFEGTPLFTYASKDHVCALQ